MSARMNSQQPWSPAQDPHKIKPAAFQHGAAEAREPSLPLLKGSYGQVMASARGRVHSLEEVAAGRVTNLHPHVYMGSTNWTPWVVKRKPT